MTLLPGVHKWGKELGLGLRKNVQNFDFGVEHSITWGSQSTTESMKQAQKMNKRISKI